MQNKMKHAGTEKGLQKKVTHQEDAQNLVISTITQFLWFIQYKFKYPKFKALELFPVPYTCFVCSLTNQ